jgi:adenosylcobinamide-GDP ribazoletransferase
MRAVRAGAGAVAFLTVVPVGRAVALGPDDVARGAALFPVVGAGVGAAVGAVAVALAGPLPALVAAVIAVSAGAVLTGAMHLDALADTADALGARSREAALEIMRDPRVGSFGMVALTLDLIAKVAALAALTSSGAVLVALAAGAASRATAPALAVALAPARDGGSGAELARRAGPAVAATAAAIALVVSALAAGWVGVAIFGTAAAVAGAVGLGARLRFGGVTGDVLGTAVELAETAGLVVAVALA